MEVQLIPESGYSHTCGYNSKLRTTTSPTMYRVRIALNPVQPSCTKIMMDQPWLRFKAETLKLEK